MLIGHVQIVPMEGDTPVNGEPQKCAAEILAETAVALTLSQLHPEPGVCVGVCICLLGFRDHTFKGI